MRKHVFGHSFTGCATLKRRIWSETGDGRRAQELDDQRVRMMDEAGLENIRYHIWAGVEFRNDQ